MMFSITEDYARACYQSALKYTHSVNLMFSEPLPYSEIKSAAKSIAKYCWKPDAHHYNEFVYCQLFKGNKGSKASKRKPVATSEPTNKPLLVLGISRRTYYNRKKLNKI